ncbi:MAG TPA: GDYXXLXY domain-containing protein [Candidatus Nanoarchaeia archaeon]|nr:GDYXXLXY domain-containing protein [Candidatus Nanoarchaeia archaeon]
MDKKKLFYIIVVLQAVLLLGMVAYKEATVAFGAKIILKTVPYDPTDFFRGDYINIRYEISDISLTSLDYNNEEFSRGNDVFVSLEPEKDKNGVDYWKAKSVSNRKKAEPYIKGTVSEIYSKTIYTIKDEESGKDYDYEVIEYEGQYYYQQPLEMSFKEGDEVQFNVFNNAATYAVKCDKELCPQNKGKLEGFKVGTIKKIAKGVKFIRISYPIESYFVPKNQGNLPQFRTGEMLVEVALWKGDSIATNILIDGQKIDFR